MKQKTLVNEENNRKQHRLVQKFPEESQGSVYQCGKIGENSITNSTKDL